MPNILTILRIIGTIPLATSIYLEGVTIHSFILFVILGVTDFFDGYLARKYNKVSQFGKIMDGVADKFLMLSVTIALLIKGIIPYWSLIIFFRDFVAILYVFYYKKKTKKIIQSNIYGKVKTTLHIVVIALVLLLGKWTIYSSVLMIIAILLFIPEIIYIYKLNKETKIKTNKIKKKTIKNK